MQTKLQNTHKNYRPDLTLTEHKFKNWSYLCAYHCAQLSYTTQREAVLTIFHLHLQTNTIAQILSIREEGGGRSVVEYNHLGFVLRQ